MGTLSLIVFNLSLSFTLSGFSKLRVDGLVLVIYFMKNYRK